MQGFWGVLGYLATSDAKSDGIFLLSDPDFLLGRRNFAPISFSYRDPHFWLFGGFGFFWQGCKRDLGVRDRDETETRPRPRRWEAETETFFETCGTLGYLKYIPLLFLLMEMFYTSILHSKSWQWVTYMTHQATDPWPIAIAFCLHTCIISLCFTDLHATHNFKLNNFFANNIFVRVLIKQKLK